METYTAMRQFADSWALLAMVLFFVGVVLRQFTGYAREAAASASAIPFNEMPARASDASEEDKGADDV